MKKFLVLATAALCLLMVDAQSEVVSNQINPDAPPTPLEDDFKPAQNLIAAIYRRAMVNSLQTKVTELHTKLSNGENALPAAVDILKIALLSGQTQDFMRKTVENVVNLMPPELKQMAKDAGVPEELTTPLPKQE